MPNNINQLKVKKLTAAIAYCVRADGGKPPFRWLDLTDDEKKNLKTVLKGVFHKDIEIDMEGLGTILEGWLEITNPETMDDRHKRA